MKIKVKNNLPSPKKCNNNNSISGKYALLTLSIIFKPAKRHTEDKRVGV